MADLDQPVAYAKGLEPVAYAKVEPVAYAKGLEPVAYAKGLRGLFLSLRYCNKNS